MLGEFNAVKQHNYWTFCHYVNSLRTTLIITTWNCWNSVILLYSNEQELF